MKTLPVKVRAGRTSVLYKYMATYALVLIIPSMLLGLFLFNNAIQQISDRYVEIQQVKLDQVSQDIDSQIARLPQMVNQIQKTQNVFLPYYWSLNKYNYVYTVWELDKIKRYSPLLEECALVYRDEDTVFTSKSYATVRDFFDSIISMQGDTDYRDAAMTADAPVLSSAVVRDSTTDRRYNALVYIYPFKMSKVSRNNMAMICILSESLFDERVRQVVGNADQALRLYQNGREAFRLGGAGALPQEQIDSFHASDGAYLQKSAGLHIVSAFKAKSAMFDMDYVMEVPWDTPMQQVAQFRRLFLAISFVTLLIGLLLVFLFSYYNYRPLRAVLDRLKRQQIASFPETSRDEYIQLDQAIRSTVTRNRALQDHINEQSQQFVQEILSALLTGAIHYRNLDQTFYIQPVLPGPHYCVLTVHTGTIEARGKEEYAELLAVLSAAPMRLAKATPLIAPKYHCVAIIANLDEGQGEDALLLEALRLHGALSLQHTVYIGVSQIHSDVNKLSHCMTEALLAQYDILERGAPGVRLYRSSLDSMTQLTLTPDAAIFSIKQSIKKGDKAQALNDMNGILSTIVRKRNPVIMQVLYYDFANNILKVINEMHLNSTTLEVDFLQLFHDPDLFQRNMELLIGDICDNVNTLKSGTAPDAFQNMLQYIDEHYLEYDLSLEHVAAVFDISATKLSKLFKSRVHVGFKEYLIEKRMTSAKQMLCFSGMSVGDIATSIGYSSESYFINMFKRLELMTPASYRRKYEIGMRTQALPHGAASPAADPR